MNFDFKILYLVNPTKLDEECYIRAVHADKILDEAKIFSSFNEAIKEIDYIVATSSIDSKSDKKHLRKPIKLDEFNNIINDVDGKIGLLFGREDYGLYNEEIAKSDIMIKIPSSDAYPTLNLSHSVGIILYSIFNKNYFKKNKRIMGKIEKEKLSEYINLLLDDIGYPDHKKEKTKIMIKRILGRSSPSKWEYHTLMGILSKTLEKLRK